MEDWSSALSDVDWSHHVGKQGRAATSSRVKWCGLPHLGRTSPLRRPCIKIHPLGQSKPWALDSRFCPALGTRHGPLAEGAGLERQSSRRVSVVDKVD